MNELDKVLEDSEKVFWEGKPKFWPFFLSGFLMSLFGLIFLIAGAVVLIQGIMTGNLLMIFFPHFWIGVALVFGLPLYRVLVYNFTYYAITNKRVLFQKGIIGRDFEMIDFDQITNIEVNVGLIDKLFGNGSGSIFVSSAGTFTSGKHGQKISRPYTILHVANPYDVFKFFKKVSHDVKTDIHYPNKYRPHDNPGYNSTYNPKK